jgi:5-hydroxyisourate hydrolase
VPGISIHAIDVARGLVAEGMRVEVFAIVEKAARRLVAEGNLSANGTLEKAELQATFARGYYEAVFHVGAYYRDAGIALGPVPFLDVVTYRFGIAEPRQHYHVPFKFTAWGYSCFRGGA